MELRVERNVRFDCLKRSMHSVEWVIDSNYTMNWQRTRLKRVTFILSDIYAAQNILWFQLLASEIHRCPDSMRSRWLLYALIISVEHRESSLVVLSEKKTLPHLLRAREWCTNMLLATHSLLIQTRGGMGWHTNHFSYLRHIHLPVNWHMLIFLHRFWSQSSQRKKISVRIVLSAQHFHSMWWLLFMHLYIEKFDQCMHCVQTIYRHIDKACPKRYIVHALAINTNGWSFISVFCRIDRRGRDSAKRTHILIWHFAFSPKMINDAIFTISNSTFLICAVYSCVISQWEQKTFWPIHNDDIECQFISQTYRHRKCIWFIGCALCICTPLIHGIDRETFSSG